VNSPSLYLPPARGGRIIRNFRVSYKSRGFDLAFSFSFLAEVAAVDIVYHCDGEVFHFQAAKYLRLRW